MRRFLIPAALLAVLPLAGRTPAVPPVANEDGNAPDSAALPVFDDYLIVDGDTLFSMFIPPVQLPHSGPLTDEDFYAIADSLGVEAAAIKAVVQIETGSTGAGFHSDGYPLVNFDSGLFRRFAGRRGVNVSAARREHPEAFTPPNIARYGSHQGAHQARLRAGMAVDTVAAIEATFWGMFQIGGFNWHLAGAESHQDFVDRVSRSEYDQLVLFANFIRNTGLLKHLRDKNWSAFAKLYNGPGYARRGYHTKMAEAYRRNRATMRRE